MTMRLRHLIRRASWLGCFGLLGVCAPPVEAQGIHEPVLGAYQFRTGVHPTVDVVLDQGDVRDIVRFWRSELNGISTKVKGRQELTGMATRIPAVSNDTLRVLLSVERGRGALYTAVHVAFFTVDGFISPESPQAEVDAAMAWVRQRTVTLRRQLAQTEMDRAERELANLERRSDLLEREQQRIGHQINRAQQRIADMDQQWQEAQEQLARLLETDSSARGAGEPIGADEQEAPRKRLPDDSLAEGDTLHTEPGADVDTIRSDQAVPDNGPEQEREGQEARAQQRVADPTDAGQDRRNEMPAKERLKEQRRWEDRARRAVRNKQSMEKRIKDLEWSLTRNEQEQKTGQAAVERQREVVEELKQKMRAIR